MTKRRLFWWVALPAVLAVIVVSGARRRHRAADTHAAVVATQQAQRPRSFPPLSPAPMQAKPDDGRKDDGVKTDPAATLLYNDSHENARLVADSDEFKAFVSNAKLTDDQQRLVSHIVALYYMDDEALRNKTTDAVKLASMRRQLLIHMHVRVRTKIPDAWDAFERTKLLPPVEAEPVKG